MRQVRTRIDLFAWDTIIILFVHLLPANHSAHAKLHGLFAKLVLTTDLTMLRFHKGGDRVLAEHLVAALGRIDQLLVVSCWWMVTVADVLHLVLHQLMVFARNFGSRAFVRIQARRAMGLTHLFLLGSNLAAQILKLC